MGSDFSTLDAELDALEGSSGLDTLALAHGYAADLSALPDVDRALSELHRGVEAPSPQDSGAFVFKPGAARAPASEEIALPEPVTRDFQDDASGEIPLPDPSPRSGSFALDEDAELSGELDLVDATAAQEAGKDVAYSAPASSLFERARANFDLTDAARPSDEQDADGAFAELFAEATRQSSMPGIARDNERSEDDTEIFDTSALGAAEAAAAYDLSAEELDSDEFEIVSDDDDDELTTSSSLPPHPSQPPPEKRPSFFDRLFGRKHE